MFEDLNDPKHFTRVDNLTLIAGDKDGEHIEVSNLSGWKSKFDGDIIFDPSTDSAKRYSQACDTLVLRKREKAKESQSQADAQDIDKLHKSALEKTGFWGNSGAGCLFISRKTKQVGLGFRGKNVLQPLCWGTIGGAVDPGETRLETVKRELQEEIGYEISTEALNDPAITQLLMMYTNGTGPDSFSYATYAIIVEDKFYPKQMHGGLAVVNEENEVAAFAWFSLDELRACAKRIVHFGVWEILDSPDRPLDKLMESL